MAIKEHHSINEKNMATKNSRRKTYENATSGHTSVDLSRICAYTTTSVNELADQWLVEFHMYSGTIFSVRMNGTEKAELGKMWHYWREA